MKQCSFCNKKSLFIKTESLTGVQYCKKCGVLGMGTLIKERVKDVYKGDVISTREMRKRTKFK